MKCRGNSNVAFTNSELVMLSEYLKVKDKQLYLFCLFVMIGLRPIELTKIGIGDITFDKKNNPTHIFLKAENEKSGDMEWKTILTSHKKYIKSFKLHKYPKYYFLFGHDRMPNEKSLTRDNFTKRFKKVKGALRLDKRKTMYAFKHTTIINLIKSGVSETEIKKIFGLKSDATFKIYAQEYLTEKPIDISTKMNLHF